MPSPDDVAEEMQDADLTMVGREILSDIAALVGGTAVTDLMRTGGTGVSARNPLKGVGTLRRRTERLARSLTGARSAVGESVRGAPEGIFDLTPTAGGVKLEYGSEVPYAGVHEYGLDDTVQVPQHTRTMTQGFGDPDDYPQEVTVRAHSREVDIPERPYLFPALVRNLDEMQDIAEDKVTDALFGPTD